jgi:hypothetical protein
LQVKDTDGVNNGASTAGWGIPIPIGAFSFKVTGGLNGVARRFASYKVNVLVANIWATGSTCSGRARDSTVALDGRFGFDDWLRRIIDTTQKSNAADLFDTSGTTIEFYLTPSLGVTPTWAIVRQNGRKFDATMPISVQREYNNKIELAITENKPTVDHGPALVCVTNLPGGTPCKPVKPPTAGKKTFGDYTIQGRVRLPSLPVPNVISPDAQRRLDNQLNTQQIQGLRILGQ